MEREARGGARLGAEERRRGEGREREAGEGEGLSRVREVPSRTERAERLSSLGLVGRIGFAKGRTLEVAAGTARRGEELAVPWQLEREECREMPDEEGPCRWPRES